MEARFLVMPRLDEFGSKSGRREGQRDRPLLPTRQIPYDLPIRLSHYFLASCRLTLCWRSVQ